MKKESCCRWLTAITVLSFGVLACGAYGAALHDTAAPTAAPGVDVSSPAQRAGDLEMRQPVQLDDGVNRLPAHTARGASGRVLPDIITCPANYTKTYSNITADDEWGYGGGVGIGVYFGDDFEPEGNDRQVGYYSVATRLITGDPAFNVQMDLARDINGADVDYITGSQCIVLNDTEDLPTTQICDITAAPVWIPDTAYVVLEFDQENAYWVIGEEAEIGYTADSMCIGIGGQEGCGWGWTNAYAGNWAEVCTLDGSGPGTGACCKGECDLTSADCYDSYDCTPGVCDSGVFMGMPCSFNNDCYYCNTAPQDHCGGLSADCPQGGGCNMGPQCIGAEACVYDCYDTTYDNCTGAGNRWGGAATACVDITWSPPCNQGACCRTTGGCYPGRLEANCHATDFAFDWKPGLICDPYDPCSVGACCYPDGSCEDTDATCGNDCDGDGTLSEYECEVVLEGEFALNDTCGTADCPAPCTLDCVITESEPCDDSGDARLNDGCNLNTPLWDYIACNGASVCGTTWAKGGTRDTDWYIIQGLDAADADSDGFVSVTVTINSQSPTDLAVRAMLISDDGNCGDLDILANGTDPCAIAWSENCGAVPDVDTDGIDEPTSYTVCLDLSVARYMVHIAPANPGGAVYNDLPCGVSGIKYELTVTCSDPCALPCCGLDQVCTMVSSPDQCSGPGLTLAPDCVTTCEDAECPLVCDESDCVGIEEPEPGCDGVNDGCNATPATFTTINCGDVYCGTTDYYSGGSYNYRDLDWYRLDLAAEDVPAALIWEVRTEFAPIIWIIRDTGADCNDLEVLSGWLQYGPCDPLTSVACVTEPDTYYMVVAPDFDENEVWDDCGGDLVGHYTALLYCGCCEDITCDGGDLSEGETTCAADYDDQFNGGCSGDAPYEFSTNLIPNGNKVCGESGNFDIGTSGIARDTDWYSRFLAEGNLLQMYVQAGFPVAASIWYDPDHDCGPNLTLVAYKTEYDCETLCLSYCIPPGEGGYYYFLVTTAEFEGIECGQHYEVWLTSEACPTIADDCVDAIAIDGVPLRGYTDAFTTTDGPSHTGVECETLSDDVFEADVWYVYTATQDGTLTVDTCSMETCFDTMLAVYDTGVCTPTAGDLLACNDDYTAVQCGSTGHGSLVEVPVESGNSYLIRVGGWAGDTGCFEIDKSFESGVVNVTAMDSLRDHGATADVAINLVPGGTASRPEIDPRVGGIRKIVLTAGATTPATCTASVSCTPGTYSGTPTCTGQSPLANQVTVEFDPELPDENCCQIHVDGLQPDQYAGTLGGDCNQDGDVTSLDYSYIKLRLGQNGTTAPQADVNTDDDVTSLDYSSVKLRLGHVLPACP